MMSILTDERNIREMNVVYYRRIRDLREDHDLTQDALIKILEMHKTTYTNYEQGKREIPFSLAIRLSRLYNVSLDYIAGSIDEPRPVEGKNMYSHK